MISDESIKSLLQSIMSAIKNYVENRASLDDTKNKYKRLLTEYRELEASILNPGFNNYMSGLLYQHNINNFSKLTSIYKLNKDSVEEVLSHGDEKIASVLTEIINNKLKSNDMEIGENIQKILINGKGKLSYYMYLYIFSNDGNDKKIISAVASSFYFKIEEFKFFCRLIEKIFQKNHELCRPLSIDYFDIISKKIWDYINQYKSATATLFVFHSIKKIFKDSALIMLSDISDSIIETLYSSYDEKSCIIPLSLTQYIAIAPFDDTSSGNTKKKRKKIVFFYHSLPIPYEMISIPISTPGSIYKFWEKIYLINNYISNGDITL